MATSWCVLIFPLLGAYTWHASCMCLSVESTELSSPLHTVVSGLVNSRPH